MAAKTCPILHLTKAAELFRFKATRPISLGLSSKEVEHAMDLIQKRLDTFEAAYKNAKTANGDTETDAMKSILAQGMLEIVQSALGASFHDKYHAEIRQQETAKQLTEFICGIFGQLSKAEKHQRAHTDIANCSRRIHDNESFTMFLNRLIIIGKEVDDNSVVQKYIIGMEFRKNLTPALKQYLLDHNKSEDSCQEIASFLDIKMKHKSNTTVNQITSDDKRLNTIEAKLDMLTDALCRVSDTKSEKSDNAPKVVNKISLQPKNDAKSDKRSDWIYNKYNKPIRCGKCGMLGHYAKICPGTCKAVCHMCQKIGHLQAACPSKN